MRSEIQSYFGGRGSRLRLRRNLSTADIAAVSGYCIIIVVGRRRQRKRGNGCRRRGGRRSDIWKSVCRGQLTILLVLLSPRMRPPPFRDAGSEREHVFGCLLRWRRSVVVIDSFKRKFHLIVMLHYAAGEEDGKKISPSSCSGGWMNFIRDPFSVI